MTITGWASIHSYYSYDYYKLNIYSRTKLFMEQKDESSKTHPLDISSLLQSKLVIYNKLNWLNYTKSITKYFSFL